VYGHDRWFIQLTGGTVTYSTQAFTVGTYPASGFVATNYARVVTSGQSAIGHYSVLCHKIEDVRTLNNEQVTVSFYAKAASGTPKIGVELLQEFGSGGSPSATVFVTPQTATLSTSWARYSVQITLPSISGKTIGTSPNSSSIAMLLWTSAGSDLNARTGSIGIQNNTIDIWGVQMERGSVASTFEQRPFGQEMLLCKRYYDRVNKRTWGMFTSAGTTARIMVETTVPMRITPTATLTTTSLDTEYWSVAQLTTSGSSVVSASGGPDGVDLLINGWNSRTLGTQAMIKENQINLSAEY
jgi:hypothetical protein